MPRLAVNVRIIGSAIGGSRLRSLDLLPCTVVISLHARRSIGPKRKRRCPTRVAITTSYKSPGTRVARRAISTSLFRRRSSACAGASSLRSRFSSCPFVSRDKTDGRFRRLPVTLVLCRAASSSRVRVCGTARDYLNV